MNRKGLWLTTLLFLGMFFTMSALLSSGSGSSTSSFGKKGYEAPSGTGIGVIELNGEIMDSLDVLKVIRGFGEADSIKAILVRIDSPGGAVAPSQEIYSELHALNETKKVVVSMGSMAASGGYYVALAAEKIIANPGTLTGSIGVILQTVDASQLATLAKLTDNTYKSGALKDMGSPWRPASDQDKKAFQAMIDNVYHQFTRTIAEERGLPIDEVQKLADGRIYTGEQALAYKLVDELGTFHRAIDVAAELGQIKGRPELVYPPADDDESIWLRLVRDSARTAVRETVQESVRQAVQGLSPSSKTRLLLKSTLQ